MSSKPFLKWPGGKFRLTDRIRSKLAPGKRLIEPFTGSAAVFLNTNYEEYLLADSNPDLINLFQQLVEEKDKFIKYCQSFFIPANNTEDKYYAFREEFNNTINQRRKSALFSYLNRHCYNGLCRYNKKGKFNTPFGRYKKPRIQDEEMREFINAAKNTTFMQADFTKTMQLARKGDVVYCDPPYVPLSDTAFFTDYHSGGFNWDDQILLVQTAQKLANTGIQIVISNHNTKEVLKLYKNAGATIDCFQVQRHISCDANNRKKADEILAVFN